MVTTHCFGRKQHVKGAMGRSLSLACTVACYFCGCSAGVAVGVINSSTWLPYILNTG
jgi:hypothetical protein